MKKKKYKLFESKRKYGMKIYTFKPLEFLGKQGKPSEKAIIRKFMTKRQERKYMAKRRELRKKQSWLYTWFSPTAYRSIMRDFQ